ncbi:restriction endonuclease subunit S [Ruminococcus bicirculans (ex Wegman et al. 2014)]|uniref:restriction endonuclease subunit S n=1 Tax=Ruminococcus bicirculans (ex Wegman et al. 2014) TaxID=1160721 RepID=UPI003FD6FB24
MALTKYCLGDLLELTTETNANNEYGARDVRGMTITKEIIPTKADVSNTDLSKFLVVHPGEFVFNPRTHGKKIGFGYNDTDSSFLISWNNIAFRIKGTMRDKVLSEYLFFHFNRAEWDREACYRSWGSSTEVFTWEALCEMELDLPPLSVQQKYVDIYNSMLANQRCYERGLEDLKLTCDAYIENLRRKTPTKKIGAYLTQSDRRNDIGLSVDFVRGLATSKAMIPTKADMDGVSLNNYKVVPPRYIAYVPDTSRRGDKVSLGFNDTDETFLVSSISTVFGTELSVLIPEYLMLFLTRSEFDRYARFNSWGSARETFNFEDMCDVEIPIPDISVQKAIADIFTAYNTRKLINERLKAQIKDLCPILVKGAVEEGEKL